MWDNLLRPVVNSNLLCWIHLNGDVRQVVSFVIATAVPAMAMMAVTFVVTANGNDLTAFRYT